MDSPLDNGIVDDVNKLFDDIMTRAYSESNPIGIWKVVKSVIENEDPNYNIKVFSLKRERFEEIIKEAIMESSLPYKKLMSMQFTPKHFEPVAPRLF